MKKAKTPAAPSATAGKEKESALFWRAQLRPEVNAAVPPAVAKSEGKKPAGAAFWKSVPAEDQKKTEATAPPIPQTAASDAFPERKRFPKNVWIVNAFSSKSAPPLDVVQVEVCGMLQWRDDHPTRGGLPFILEEWDRTTIDPLLPVNAMLCQRLRDADLFCPPFAFRMNPTTLMLYMVAYVLETCYTVTDGGKWTPTNQISVPVIVRAVQTQPLFGKKDSINLFTYLLKIAPHDKVSAENNLINDALPVLYDTSKTEDAIPSVSNAPPLSFSHKCFLLASAICCHSEKSNGFTSFNCGAFALYVSEEPPMEAHGTSRIRIPQQLIEHISPYRWTAPGIKFLMANQLAKPTKKNVADADDLYEALAWSPETRVREEALHQLPHDQYMELVKSYRRDWVMDLFDAVKFYDHDARSKRITLAEAKKAEDDLSSRGRGVNRTNAKTLVDVNPDWMLNYPDVRDQDSILTLAMYDFSFNQEWIDAQYRKRSKVTKAQIVKATVYFTKNNITITVDNAAKVLRETASIHLQFPDAVAVDYMSFLLRGPRESSGRKKGVAAVEEAEEEEEEEEP